MRRACESYYVCCNPEIWSRVIIKTAKSAKVHNLVLFYFLETTRSVLTRYILLLKVFAKLIGKW